MLREVAVKYLKILILCEKYNYTVIDGHPWNWLFDFSSPKWCDFGSFHKKNNSQESCAGFYEFLRTVYWPLQLWAKGHDYLANVILSDECYHRIQFTEQPAILKQFQKCFNFPLRIINKIYRLLFRSSERLINYDLVFYQYLLNRLQRSAPVLKETFWSNYQTDFYQKSKNNYKRFSRISELLHEHCPDVESAIDLAANQGELIKFLLANKNIHWGICIDYDIGAIDHLYKTILGKSLKIFVGCKNLMDYDEAHKKQKVDLVLATAITHHLVLSQKIPIDMFFTEIAQKSLKYVLVEFMPLGLWNGVAAPPIPPWYTEEWFKSHFCSHFRFITKEQLEPNRIVYIGQKLQ